MMLYRDLLKIAATKWKEVFHILSRKAQDQIANAGIKKSIRHYQQGLIKGLHNRIPKVENKLRQRFNNSLIELNVKAPSINIHRKGPLSRIFYNDKIPFGDTSKVTPGIFTTITINNKNLPVTVKNKKMRRIYDALSLHHELDELSAIAKSNKIKNIKNLQNLKKDRERQLRFFSKELIKNPDPIHSIPRATMMGLDKAINRTVKKEIINVPHKFKKLMGEVQIPTGHHNIGIVGKESERIRKLPFNEILHKMDKLREGTLQAQVIRERINKPDYLYGITKLSPSDIKKLERHVGKHNLQRRPLDAKELNDVLRYYMR